MKSERSLPCSQEPSIVYLYITILKNNINYEIQAWHASDLTREPASQDLRRHFPSNLSINRTRQVGNARKDLQQRLYIIWGFVTNRI
jgi:hypothetical protein